MRARIILLLLPWLGFNLRAAILAGPIVNPRNHHTYFLLAPGSWSRAQEQARLLGGNLVTINDEAECEWIVATFVNFGGAPTPMWIGLNDRDSEGNFTWVSGEYSSFRNWHPGEPNNDAGWGTPENYAFIYPGARSAGNWRDANEHAKSDLETDPGRWNTGPDGDIGCFGLVELNGVGVPVTLEINQQAGQVTISWAAQPGGSYQVYEASPLYPLVWQASGEVLVATSPQLSFKADAQAAGRFYRVFQIFP